MQIEHKQLVEGSKVVIYLDVSIEDNYEFGKENFNYSINTKNIANEIKKYIKKNVEYIKGAVVVVAINGVLIGALTLTPEKEIQMPEESESLARTFLELVLSGNKMQLVEFLFPLEK